MHFIRPLLCTLLLTLAATTFSAKHTYAEMTARFLGNTTIVFDDGKDVIMTDGFLSRLGFENYALGIKVDTDPGRVRDAFIHAELNAAAAIFVAHAHFDHGMDARYVSNAFGADVYGSRSTRALVRAKPRAPDQHQAGNLDAQTKEDIERLQPVPESRIKVLHDERSYRVGDFTITAIYSPHGDPNRFPGELRPGIQMPLRMRDMLANENYSFHIRRGAATALVVPGGNYLTGKLWQKRYRADTVFLGIGGLHSADREAAKRGNPNFMETYWFETVEAVKAKTVVPIHWDNFFKKLEPGVDFSTPPRVIEDFPAVRKKLGRLVEAHNSQSARQICLVWLEKPFLKLDLAAGNHCAPGQHVAVRSEPEKK